MSLNDTMEPLFVGIDVGKNVHCYAAYVGLELQPLFAPRTVLTSSASYADFAAWLREQLDMQRYSRIVVGLEPTGVYHEPWSAALERDFAQQVELRWVDPARTFHARQQLQQRPERKSDPADVEALAHCLRDNLGRRLSFRAPELSELASCCSRHYVLKHERLQLGNRLHSLIDRLWPGALVNLAAYRKVHPDLDSPEPLAATRGLERRLVRTVLELDPNPYTWLARTPEEIQVVLRTAGLPCGPRTAQRLWRVAHNAMLLSTETTALYAGYVRDDLARYIQLEAQLAALQTRAVALFRTTRAVGIAAIPGISEFLAAQYVAIVGDVRRFDHADQIWSLVGFDTVQDNSGDRRRLGKLTKRGAPWQRATLYQMGLSASLKCPAIAQAKARARQRGMSRVAATLHAAHKVNRICFHLYQHNERFDPQLLR